MCTSVSPLSDWKRYKRYTDNAKLEARLVLSGRKKMMETREGREGDFLCPHCHRVISEGNADQFPPTLLKPPTFHSLHKPLD